MKRLLPLVLTLILSLSAKGQNVEADTADLLRMHEIVIRAHLQNDLDSWMAIEADKVISANGGKVTFPSRSDREKARLSYLPIATYSSYRDVKHPVIRISEDGTLGWLIAEVEVVGEYKQSDGSEEHFSNVWAWIELYARSESGWKLVGNVSNSRELK